MGPSVHPSVHKMRISEPFWAILGSFQDISSGFGGIFGLVWVVFRPLRGVSEAFLALSGDFQAILRGFRGILVHFGLFLVVSEAFCRMLGSFWWFQRPF